MATLKNRPLQRVKQTLWNLLRGFLLFSLFSVLLLSFVDPCFWSWRIQRAIVPPQPVKTVRHQWVELEKINSNLQLAVMAAEDQRFLEHNGIDWSAIQAAMSHNQTGKSVHGGSTLTQQTAKNLFLWGGRSFVRKGLELWFAFLLETGWSKARILEVYLNIVEFGPGIFGAEAAAQHYFHKSAQRLTPHEAALLAAVLPNPWLYRANPPSHYVARRAAWIQRQMRQLGDGMVRELTQR